MRAAPPDYYAILGLATTATPDEIKRSYRELARRYHPDVNSSPDASQRIKAINEAHHVLSDPDRRAVYDADRLLRGPAAAPPARGTKPQRPSQASKAPPKPAYGFNGFGRTANSRPSPEPGPSPGARPRSAPRQPQQSERSTTGPAYAPRQETPPGTKKPADSERVNSRASVVQGLLSEARLALVNRRLRDAESLCQQGLRLSARNPDLYELLGDIYTRGGRSEEATSAYSYAIQFNPRNYSVYGKLDRVIGRDDLGGPTAGRMRRASWAANHADAAQSLLSTVLLFALGCVLFAFYTNPGAPISFDLPWLTRLSLNMLIALGCTGLIVGILLAFYGGMRPVSEELVRRETATVHAGNAMSLPILLSMFAAAWVVLSLVIFLVVSVARNRMSGSLLRVYLAVAACSGGFAMLVEQAGAQSGMHIDALTTAAFAGNALFPAAIIGWYLGDSIRLRGR